MESGETAAIPFYQFSAIKPKNQALELWVTPLGKKDLKGFYTFLR